MPVSKGYWVYHKWGYLENSYHPVWHMHQISWGPPIILFIWKRKIPCCPNKFFEGRSLILIEQIITVYLWKVSFIRRPLHLFLLFQTFLLVVGMVVVMVTAIPWIAIPVIPLGIIFFVLRWYFLRTSRDVKRLECTSEYRGSQVGIQCRLASIYAIINQTPEILQTLSSGISHKSTLDNWMLWPLWVSVVLKANKLVAGQLHLCILAQGEWMWAPWGQGPFLSCSWHIS